MEHGDKIPALFASSPRWKVIRRRDKEHVSTRERKEALTKPYYGLNCYDVTWNDGKGEKSFHELADILEALTITRYDLGLAATLDPYARHISNLVNPQLSLPLTKKIWNESSCP